jgi:transglutaminase-like putative cysteine protease
MLALTLVVLEAAAMTLLSHSPAVPVVAVVCAVTGILTRWRVAPTRQRMYDVIAMLALLFIVKYMLLPDNPRYTGLFPSQPIALAVGEFVLVLQALSFFVARRDDRLPFLVPGMGVIALACTAIVEVNTRERMLFQAACVAFAMLASLYYDTSRRFVVVTPSGRFGRPVATAIALVIVGTMAWCSASALHRYERQMDLWVRRYLMDDFVPQSIGLSNSSTIGSVSLQKTQDSQAVALRVSSTAQPDYFRGRAFSTYHSNEWSAAVGMRTISPSEQRAATIPAARHMGQEFAIGDVGRTATWAFEVWPSDGLAGSYLAPLGTVWLQAACLDVTANVHVVLQSHQAMPGSPYTIHVSSQNPVQSRIGPDDLLRQPPAWATTSPAIARLADSLFADCETTTDRIRSVTAYFRNYDYSLEVAVPSDWQGDPVAWFLLERPAAHCEFFASGTVMLLRMADVPCRYVTGFVFTGKNRFSGEWIARNRDAHAWVEAWDQESGRWVTVESTPGSGVPQPQAESDSSQLGEYLAHRFHQLRVRWRQEGIRLIGHLVLSALLSPVGLGLFGTALVVAGFVLQRRLRNREHRSPELVDRSLAPLHAVLHIVDRRVERYCRRRRVAGETLTAFANELAARAGAQSADPNDPLRQVAAWYRTYTALRYGAARSTDAIDRIRHDGQQLARRLRGRRVDSDQPSAEATK